MYYKMDNIMNEVNLLLKLINKEGLNDFAINNIENDKYHVLDIPIDVDRFFVYYLKDSYANRLTLKDFILNSGAMMIGFSFAFSAFILSLPSAFMSASISRITSA